MDTTQFEPLLTRTTWLEDNRDKRSSYPKYVKMIKGGKQALPLTHERKIIYLYAMDNVKQCTELFLPFVQAFFYPLEVRITDWSDHPFKKQKKYTSKKWERYTDSDSESSDDENDVVSKKVKELMGDMLNDEPTHLQYDLVQVCATLKEILPADAYCATAITSVDICEDRYDYVIGKADLRSRTGIVSTARYTPGWDEFIEDESEYGYAWRCMNVIAHEICHSLGIAHCVYYHCIMNGSDTGDDRPIITCPICLKKVAHNIGQVATFDVVTRYQKLEEVYKKNGFTNDVIWIQERLKQI
jgi:predicted Zn-dependent protease